MHGAATGTPGATRVARSAGLILGWACLMAAAPLDSVLTATEPGASPPDVLVDFDIPAQPLEAALNEYGAVTRLPALYPSDLPMGLYSASVQGRYSPHDALRQLLQGTGVVVEKLGDADGGVYRLRRATPSPSTAGTGLSVSAGSARVTGYLSRLHASVMQALCRDARTAPGDYEAMFRVAVDARGRAAQASLVGSSGDAQRDAVLLATLRQVRTSSPPPASANVPYLFTLRPAAPGTPLPCGAPVLGAP